MSMLGLIDTLLGTLSSEEKEVLERKSRIALNRPRKLFTGTKDRAKRRTRNDAWTFLSEYYGIVFRAPICDQLCSLLPQTQSEQTDTLLGTKRKRESSLSNNDQLVLKKARVMNDQNRSFSVNNPGGCVNHGWLRKFLDDNAVLSSSGELGQTSCSDTSQGNKGEEEVEPTSLSTVGNDVRVQTYTTRDQDPCLLLGLYELFKHKRELFDKLCAELNI